MELGSHNGIKSVIEKLSSENFMRIRIGIGSPKYKEDIVNYVIGNIPKEEAEVLDNSAAKAADAIIEILENGIDSSMNKFN